MPERRSATVIGTVLVLGWIGSAGAGDAPWEALPPGEGRMETYSVCSACHSIRLVQQQGMTRAQWAETLQWMVEEQGMAVLPPGLRGLILDYLAAVFSPDRPYYEPGGEQAFSAGIRPLP